jgi:excinuclease ABC subunit B
MSSMILLTTKFCSSASFVHHTSHAHFPGVSRATTILQTHTLRSFSSASIVAFKDESNFISGDDEDFTDEISRTETLPNEHGKKLFKVTAKFPPTGHQPKAIDQLTKQLLDGDKYSILQGITGTGKTLVMAHTIANVNVGPTLVLVHNKTLAAQLARELRAFLKENAVELFISYYDHYVPESFVETTGKYIAKKTAINKEIDALRHKATRALLTRDDVVVVASVSCIYGLGLPKEYLDNSMRLHAGTYLSWKDFMKSLDRMLYDVSVDDGDFERGQYQLYEETLTDNKNRKTIVLWPPHERFPMQIIMDQDSLMDSDRFRVASIRTGNQLGLTDITSIHIFPAKHHVIGEERLETACQAIEDELSHRVKELMAEGKYIESERLQQRTLNDLMIIRETGFCSGIENYSRHFAGKAAGERPDTLMDYLAASGRKWLLVIDESHVTLPQLSAMYAGDQARKRRLVKHGYRLPSALDNRPLKDSEFWDQVEQTVFVSATPSKKELVLSKKSPIEMFIRPTFVCDPKIEVRPKKNQLESLLAEIQQRATKQERCLAVAITKRDAEDLSSYLNEKGVRSTFIHSGLKPHARSEALKALQNGEVDCLVGVNLLREGLDLPQVSLVAILSADSEGFLRSETSLLQTVGRAARNINGHAIFFADQITESMRKCIESTEERRRIQLDFNEFHGHKMMSTKGKDK